MKLLKSLLVASSIVLASISAQAAEKNATKQNAPAQQQNAQLKNFNNSVKIIPVSRSTGKDKQNNSYAVIQYNIENTSKRAIKSITWIGVYGVNNTILHQQQIPVKFDKPIAKGAKVDVTVTIPFTALTQQTQAAFLDTKSELKVLSVAREIVFSNGSKIQVKD